MIFPKITSSSGSFPSNLQDHTGCSPWFSDDFPIEIAMLPMPGQAAMWLGATKPTTSPVSGSVANKGARAPGGGKTQFTGESSISLIFGVYTSFWKIHLHTCEKCIPDLIWGILVITSIWWDTHPKTVVKLELHPQSSDGFSKWMMIYIYK